MLRERLCCWIALFVIHSACLAQSIATNSPGGKPLSDRIVHYTISAKYDAKDHTLEGDETLVYENKTEQPLSAFPFHLYLNGFQPQSTWVTEAHRDGSAVTRFQPKNSDKELGAIEIKQFIVDGVGDLTGQLAFISPDDGNKDDKTVVQVKLPKAVAPGASVTFHIKFHDKFPQTVARTGYYRDFIMGAQWFPKVGVWWHGAWNCHQFHESTEFFSDFGVYDVKLNLPAEFVVGASGIETGSATQPDGTVTHAWHGEDIHDFAWAASPHFVIFDDTFQSSMGPVKMHALVHYGHRQQGQRYLASLRETMKRFDQWYGPYPYKQITLIDPEPGSEAGGMEYPTLFTGGTAWWMPNGIYGVETVTEHEFGHQYWYAMVATNEFEEAWLDEGINQYVETKVMGDWLGEATSLVNMRHIATASDADFSRFEYVTMADTDPLTRNAWQYMTGNTYGGVTYGKTSVVLRTLESIIGEAKVREALRTWFTRYRFTHPTGEDFMRTIEEVSGQDLKWYFDQAIRGTQVLDYEIKELSSGPQQWWKEQQGKKEDTVFRTIVTVHRKGDFIFPVDVEVKFDNGETVREHWNGRDRWTRFTYDKKGARAVSAEVDPDHKVWLDTDRYNNSRVVTPNTLASRKLSNYWGFATELAAQAMSWLF